jgi:hypothetical protein
MHKTHIAGATQNVIENIAEINCGGTGAPRALGG